MLVRSSLMVSASQVGGQFIEVDVQDLCQPVEEWKGNYILD